MELQRYESSGVRLGHAVLYKTEQTLGRADIRFLEYAFQGLMPNFNWGVSRKAPAGCNLFAGGFLGEDIAGSGFAITSHTVHTSLGGNAALARPRERLRQRGLRLLPVLLLTTPA